MKLTPKYWTHLYNTHKIYVTQHAQGENKILPYKVHFLMISAEDILFPHYFFKFSSNIGNCHIESSEYDFNYHFLLKSSIRRLQPCIWY